MADWNAGDKVVKPFNSPIGSRQVEDADPRELGKPTEVLPERGVGAPIPPGLQGKPEAPGHQQPGIGGQGNEPGLPSFITTGISKLAHVVPSVAMGNFAHAANDVFGGVGSLVAPLAVPTIVANPAAALGAAALGTGGSMAGSAIADYMGASPDQSELAGNVAALPFGAAGASLGRKVPSIFKAATSPGVKSAVVDAIPKGRKLANVWESFRKAMNPESMIEVPSAITGMRPRVQDPTLPVPGGRPGVQSGNKSPIASIPAHPIEPSIPGKPFPSPAPGYVSSVSPRPPNPNPTPFTPPIKLPEGSGILIPGQRSPIVEPSGLYGPRGERLSMFSPQSGSGTPQAQFQPAPGPGLRQGIAGAPEFRSRYDPRDTRIIEPSAEPPSEVKSIVTARERNGGAAPSAAPQSMFARPRAGEVTEVPVRSGPWSMLEPAEKPSDNVPPAFRDTPQDIHPNHAGARVKMADRHADAHRKLGLEAPPVNDDAAWARRTQQLGEKRTPGMDTREMIHERLKTDGGPRESPSLEDQLAASLAARGKP